MKLRVVLTGLLLVLLIEAPAHGACPAAQLTSIHAIKGYEASTVARNRPITVEGVVTGVFLGEERLRGFYLQQQRSGGEQAGLFVYLPNVPLREEKLIQSGNHLQLRARAGEFRGQTQLQRVEEVRLCGRDRLPAPLAVHWPLSPERLARLEGLLLTFPQPLTVTGNHELGRYGTLALSAQGRLFRPGNDPRPARQQAPLLLDDGSYRGNPQPIPYLDRQGSRRVGSTVEGLTGILAYAFDAYRLHPVQAVSFIDGNPRPGPPTAPGERIRVAGLNVENYFLTPGARGASDAAELERQRQKLAATVQGIDADILALSEVENDPRALADLVAQLNRRLPRQLHYRAMGGPATRGGDAIKLALLYRPERVRPVSETYSDSAAVHNRPPLAAFFRAHGEASQPFGVVTAHFKSKTRCPARGDIDRGQGCWNRRRVAQSRALLDFLDRLERARGHDRILLIGDINSYGAEDPVMALKDGGLIDLIARDLPPKARYSYVFRGESGYLDHALASASLGAAVSRLQIWHINADEPRFLGYDRPPHAAELFRPDPYRSSDHDPIIVDLEPAAPRPH